MENDDVKLITPIYLKIRSDMPWPKDKVFYMLSGDGIFICRNHRFYRSGVPARNWPGELAGQKEFIQLRYPKIPQELMEQAVGFFTIIGTAHDAEAALILIWDELKDEVRLMAPRQRSGVYESWNGNRFPTGVDYELPSNLPSGCLIFGDIHSHVDHSAYASAVDQLDEDYRPGLHIVVGRIFMEPPQFHVEATVDGVRFLVDPKQVFENYQCRSKTVPREWLDQVEISVQYPSRYGS